MRAFTLGLLITLFASCTASTTMTRTVDDAPRLAIAGAPAGAILVIDGLAIGPTADYSSETPLTVLPGTHSVEVQLGSRTVHSEQIYSGTGSTVTVKVRP